jgi:prepilin-type N-terminal cleavage/methylation domain-containing protein
MWQRKSRMKMKNCCSSINMDNRGFTLLEIMLAFFIFSIIIFTIFTTYTGTFKTINLTESRLELYRRASIAMERISEDLQASYVSVLPPDSFGRPAEYTQFIGEDNQINGRDADSVSFFSRIPQMFSDGEETVSGLLISYEVVEDTENEELKLLRSENPEFTDDTELKEGLLLCDGLQSVSFTYYDEEGDEYDSWDSESENSKGRLPRLVSIGLEFINEENPEEPIKFMSSVNLQVNYVPRL